MKLDERGKQCPKPVIDTKKALESCNPGETVEVLVDNEIAVQNLSKMAASKGLSAVSEKISDNEFSVKIPVGQGVTPASGAPMIRMRNRRPACLTAAKRAWQWFCPPTLWATVTLNLERLS